MKQEMGCQNLFRKILLHYIITVHKLQYKSYIKHIILNTLSLISKLWHAGHYETGKRIVIPSAILHAVRTRVNVMCSSVVKFTKDPLHI